MSERVKTSAGAGAPAGSDPDSGDTWGDETPTQVSAPMLLQSDVRAIARRSDGGREGFGARLGAIIAERYELDRLLGSGATGAVYEALDVEGGGRVAIKLLHPHLRASDGHVARFAREIRATTSIAHPSVVQVLDAGEDQDGTLFLVMELLEGELLFDRIAEKLSTRDIVEIGRQLLGVLEAAHALGVVHRDIKPENLFLTRTDSGSFLLKVLDFGIAKLVRPTSISFQTIDGLILGTPAYMSPEICRGQPVTEAADLWAAAAVLFEAFTGEPPFDDEHVGRLLLKVVKGRAPPLGEKRPDLPASIVLAIDRALHPDLAERWQSAAELSFALCRTEL